MVHSKKYGIIYKITNKINRKVYIGQTVRDFNKRYGGSLNNTHNEHLRNSINKYGIENFEIIEEFDVAYSKEDLNKREKYWINYYNTTNPKYGYNMTDGGNSCTRTFLFKLKNAIKNKTFIYDDVDNRVYLNANHCGYIKNINPKSLYGCLHSGHNKMYENFHFCCDSNSRKSIIIDIETNEMFYGWKTVSEKYDLLYDTVKHSGNSIKNKVITKCGKKNFMNVEKYVEQID